MITSLSLQERRFVLTMIRKVGAVVVVLISGVCKKELLIFLAFALSAANSIGNL